MPRSIPGKWSAGLIAAFFVLFIIFQILVATGQQGVETFFDNLLLSIPISIAAACGLAAFVTGLIGVVRSKERSIIVYLAILIL